MNQCFRLYLRQFFDSNKLFLEKQYPGLSFDDLWNFFLDDSLGFVDEKSWLPSNHHFYKKLEDLLKGRPIAQIFSGRYFYNSYFYINQFVLIPRFETEILVEQGINFLKKSNISNPAVCDIGTGSGAIILALLKEFDLSINALAIDISDEALSVAKVNAYKLSYSFNPKSQLNFLLGDRLYLVDRKFDLILSNPPYIPRSLSKGVHKQVKEYEPDMALFLEDDDYEKWFDIFFSQIKERLNQSGLAIVELHEDTIDQLFELAKRIGFDTTLQKDLCGKNRFLFLKQY